MADHGLQPPKAVVEATAAYLEAEDAVAAWMADEWKRDPKPWEASADLFASWSRWATAAGESGRHPAEAHPRPSERPRLHHQAHEDGGGDFWACDQRRWDVIRSGTNIRLRQASAAARRGPTSSEAACWP